MLVITAWTEARKIKLDIQRLKFVNESKQWVNFVEPINRNWCWKGESLRVIALLVSPAVFFLSNGNENCSLTSGKSVNFWVDFLLNAKVYSKKKTRYAYYITWTYCRKILRPKFAGADTLTELVSWPSGKQFSSSSQCALLASSRSMEIEAGCLNT